MDDNPVPFRLVDKCLEIVFEMLNHLRANGVRLLAAFACLSCVVPVAQARDADREANQAQGARQESVSERRILMMLRVPASGFSAEAGLMIGMNFVLTSSTICVSSCGCGSA